MEKPRICREILNVLSVYQVGEGIRNAIAAGVVTRADLHVTSKLWNTFHSKDHVRMACKKTLDDLGLDYLDLYIIHFPISLKASCNFNYFPALWTNYCFIM